MDEAACQRLLAAYDNDPHVRISDRFVYKRRLAGLLSGSMMLNLAHLQGHTGATGGETLESTGSLGDFYQRMRTGAVSVASAEGQWLFGLALAKAGIEDWRAGGN